MGRAAVRRVFGAAVPLNVPGRAPVALLRAAAGRGAAEGVRRVAPPAVRGREAAAGLVETLLTRAERAGVGGAAGVRFCARGLGGREETGFDEAPEARRKVGF